MKLKVNQEPLISIITCFLNQERFLAETIESVLRQEYHNWELWLIDDGSTDGSTQLAKAYAANYPGKIRYHDHEGHRNLGASASRNVGIGHARGELITFLDGDDVWLPGLLKELFSLMQQHQVGMVCEASEYWHSWSGAGKADTVVYVGNKQDCTFQPPQLLQELYPLGKGAAPCICGLLVKKEVLQKHGGFEACFKGMYDDQALLIKIYVHERVYISSGYHNLYRQRPESLVGSSHASGMYMHERKRFLEWLETYLREQQLTDQKIHQLLQKALLPYRHPQRYYLTETLPGQLKHLVKRGYKNLFQSS